jgi:hypothetical protein
MVSETSRGGAGLGGKRSFHVTITIETERFLVTRKFDL